MTQPTFPARRPRIAHLLRPAWRRPGFRVPFMLLVLVLALAGGSAPAAAHAPGFATALNDLSLLEGPGPAAAVLAIVPTGAEVELTGAAAGDLVEVIFAGQQGWAAAADLDAGHLTDGGIELATAITPTDLLLSPHPGPSPWPSLLPAPP